MVNKPRNGFWPSKLWIIAAISSFRSSSQAARKPKGLGTGCSLPSGRLAVQRSLISVILSFLPLLNATPVLAQNKDDTPNLLDMSLEDLMSIEIDSVYGASGFKQKVTEAPASVTIITSEEIQKFGYQTLADILRNVRGFYVTYDRNYSYLGVRGYGPSGDYNSRIAVLIDGHRVNENIFDSAPFGTEFPIDVDLIDRVEFISVCRQRLLGSHQHHYQAGAGFAKDQRSRPSRQLRLLPGPRQLRRQA